MVFLRSGILGLVLGLTMVFGNPAHAVISHDHSDHHHAGESAVWESLHAALRHEEKSILPVVMLLLVAAVMLFVRRNPIRQKAPVLFAMLEYLRRGIVPHRRFG